MREEYRKHLLTNDTAHLIKTPSTGVYYLVPTREGGYEFWFDRADLPYLTPDEATLHFCFWSNIVREVLEQKWGLPSGSMGDYYASIPRGRVDAGKGEVYIIVNGDDVSPYPIDRVVTAFGLFEPMRNGRLTIQIDTVHQSISKKQSSFFKRKITRK